MSEETSRPPRTIEELRASSPLFGNLPDLPEPYLLDVDQTIRVTLAAQAVRDEYAKLHATFEASKPKGEQEAYDRKLVLKDTYDVVVSEGVIIKTVDQLARFLVPDETKWAGYTRGRTMEDLFTMSVGLVFFYETSLGKHGN